MTLDLNKMTFMIVDPSLTVLDPASPEALVANALDASKKEGVLSDDKPAPVIAGLVMVGAMIAFFYFVFWRSMFL